MRRRRLSNLRISAEIQKKKEQICDISGCFDDDEEGNPPTCVVTEMQKKVARGSLSEQERRSFLCILI
ncbi:Protein Bicaudal D-like 2 [Manis pentadactyla]|nr:Protein Bicaudal D-like 2 [Manis pentadactyla]